MIKTIKLTLIIILSISTSLLLTVVKEQRGYNGAIVGIKDMLLQDIQDLSKTNSSLRDENAKLIRLMELQESLGELSHKIPLEELEMLLEHIPHGDVFRVPYKVTAKFGESPGIDGKYRKKHSGVDLIPIEFNWLITPLAEGFVENYAINSILGKNVTIQHNEYVKTVYAHGKTIYDRATTGHTVKDNDAIMLMGNSGISDGIHLHLELILKTSIGWIHIDPEPYLINLVKEN